MLIKIITVGKTKDKNLLAKTEEFLKWLTIHAKIELNELKDSDKAKESQAILKQLEHEDREKSYIIILSEEGKTFTSREFSTLLSNIDKKIVFVIGGPFGMSDEVKRRGDLLLSLSSMTFTHEMAKMFLTEQIYRAVSIASGGKYHND